MGYQNNILIRTSLGDEGVIGKRKFSYQSPDMIAHTQVENPDEYFKENYDKDVNMALDKNSGTNFVYVRGKKSSRWCGNKWICMVILLWFIIIYETKSVEQQKGIYGGW